LNARWSETSRRRSLASPQGARGRLAAADAKAFDEALSRRDESLANVKRRQDGAMAKK
jgi:hypothetical protein